MPRIVNYQKDIRAIENAIGVCLQLDELADLLRGESESSEVRSSVMADAFEKSAEQMEQSCDRLQSKITALQIDAESMLDALRTMDGDSQLLYDLYVNGRSVRSIAEDRGITQDAVRKARDKALTDYEIAERRPRPIG